MTDKLKPSDPANEVKPAPLPEKITVRVGVSGLPPYVVLSIEGLRGGFPEPACKGYDLYFDTPADLIAAFSEAIAQAKEIPTWCKEFSDEK